MNDMGKHLTYQELMTAYNKLIMENELLHEREIWLSAGMSERMGQAIM